MEIIACLTTLFQNIYRFLLRRVDKQPTMHCLRITIAHKILTRVFLGIPV